MSTSVGAQMPSKTPYFTRSIYTQNASARRSVQSRRPEAAMSSAQLLELRTTELVIRRVDPWSGLGKLPVKTCFTLARWEGWSAGRQGGNLKVRLCLLP